MAEDALFSLFGYGVKLSDLIASAAFAMSSYTGISTRLAAKRSERREREREAAKKEIRAEIQAVTYDNQQPLRFVKLRLCSGEDGIEHLVRRCEVLEPKTSRIDIYREGGEKLYYGSASAAVEFNEILVVGSEPVNLVVIEHSVAK